MLKRVLLPVLAAATMTMAVPSVANALAGHNGIYLNGWSLNGLALNGLALNGLALNGLAMNGWSLNGVAMNGWSLNGIPMNGTGVNGFSVNGSGPGGDVAFQAVRLTLPDGVELTFR